MSGEEISNYSFKKLQEKPKKVNINVLLKKVREDKRKEQIESNVFFGLIVAVIVTTGIIISL